MILNTLLLKRLGIAAGISLGLMALFMPLNLWLFDQVNHSDPETREAVNRNFVASVINQTLLIVTVAFTATNLMQLVYLRRVATYFMDNPVQTKEAFKAQAPSVPDHYLEPKENVDLDIKVRGPVIVDANTDTTTTTTAATTDNNNTDKK